MRPLLCEFAAVSQPPPPPRLTISSKPFPGGPSYLSELWLKKKPEFNTEKKTNVEFHKFNALKAGRVVLKDLGTSDDHCGSRLWFVFFYLRHEKIWYLLIPKFTDWVEKPSGTFAEVLLQSRVYGRTFSWIYTTLLLSIQLLLSLKCRDFFTYKSFILIHKKIKLVYFILEQTEIML